MDLDNWWNIVERARTEAGPKAGDRNTPNDPLPAALSAALTTLPPEALVEWSVTHVQLIDKAYQHPLWNAAYLIEGGCGDDGFMDFRDGLVLQGRAVFDRAVTDPDTLADVPVVQRMAKDSGWLGYEAISYLVNAAYRGADGDAQVMEAAIRALPRPTTPAGPNWDPEDDEENRRHLPRLTALFADG